MAPGLQVWVVEGHDLGALQVRPAADAVTINRKHYLETGKADRLLLGVAGSLIEALALERELKRMRREAREAEPGSAAPREKGEGDGGLDGSAE